MKVREGCSDQKNNLCVTITCKYNHGELNIYDECTISIVSISVKQPERKSKSERGKIDNINALKTTQTAHDNLWMLIMFA